MVGAAQALHRQGTELLHVQHLGKDHHRLERQWIGVNWMGTYSSGVPVYTTSEILLVLGHE